MQGEGMAPGDCRRAAAAEDQALVVAQKNN